MSTPDVTVRPAPRIGARVLLLDQVDRALLIHACDPDDPAHHWWELPGGGVDPGETLTDTAIREVAEETGIVLDAVGPCVWLRETRFLSSPEPTQIGTTAEVYEFCGVGRKP